jgi:broad specificity phosphatase PhoE
MRRAPGRPAELDGRRRSPAASGLPENERAVDPSRTEAITVQRPTLLLVRHARTDWNRQHRLNSTADLPLDAEGQRMAEVLAASLAHLAAPVLASPARRARETAAPLAAASGQRLEIDDRLVEVAFGRFEGCTMASLADDPTFDRWRAGRDDLGERGPGAADGPAPEPLPVAARRLRPFLDEVDERFTSEPLVVTIGHGVALRVLLCVGVLGLPPQAYRRLRLDNAHGALLTPASDESGHRLAACNLPPDAVVSLLAS